jgi:hypothetical protein
MISAFGWRQGANLATTPGYRIGVRQGKPHRVEPVGGDEDR